MKVVLLQDVKGLGRRMDIKEVSDGYARNFLIPQKLAVPADRQNIGRRAEFESKETTLLNSLRLIAERLANEVLIFKIKTGAKGEVFSSITNEDIKKALLAKKLINESAEILLDKPLRAIGEQRVPINLGRGVRAEIMVSVKPQLE